MARPAVDPTIPFPWRPRADDLLKIAVFFAMSRLILVAVGVFSWGFQIPSTSWRGVDRSGIEYTLVPDQPLLDMWTRWDAWQYEEIARRGYWYDFDLKPRPYGTVACFPFYPMVVRGVGLILGGRYVVAGLVVSNLAALAGFVLLFQWATWWGDRPGAWVAVSAAILAPVGFFWSALYPQSLFFALSMGAMALMFDGRVAMASLVAGAATATRFEGIALVPSLLAILVRRDRGRFHREWLWVLVAPLGLVSYMAYLYGRWGNPLLFLRVHAIFGRGLSNPLWTLIEPLTRPALYQNPNALTTYGVAGLLALGYRARLPWPFLLYGWLLYLIPLTTGSYISIYRIHLVNVPIYLALGLGLDGRWRPLAWAMVAVSALTSLATMFMWVVGFPFP